MAKCKCRNHGDSCRCPCATVYKWPRIDGTDLWERSSTFLKCAKEVEEVRETSLSGKAHSFTNLPCCHLPNVERAFREWNTKSSTGNIFSFACMHVHMLTCVCRDKTTFFVIGLESEVTDTVRKPMWRGGVNKIQALGDKRGDTQVGHSHRCFVCLCMWGGPFHLPSQL